MALNNLRDFIKAIDGIGELVRVTHPVRARLEVAEIADRVMKSPGGGPGAAVRACAAGGRPRSSHPVAINLFGSMRRMCLALGAENLDDIGGRISEMLNLKVPEGLFGKLAMLPKLAEIGKFPPRVKGGRPALPGAGAARRRREPRRHPISHHLAGGRRPVHHPADGDHHRSRRGDPQRRHVPGPGARAQHARDALAAPQGGRGALARDGRSGRADAGGDRARRRSREHLLRLRAASAHDRRVPVRRLPPARAGGARQGRHQRPRRAGRSGVGARGLHRSGRGAGAGRARSATTPASTPWPTTTPRCTSPR